MEIGCNTVTQSKPSLDNVWIGPCLSTGKPVDSEGEEGSLHKNCIDSLHILFPGFWQSPNDQCINIQHIFGGWNRSDLKHWEFWNSKQFLHSKSWMEHSILVTNHGLAVPLFERKHQVLPIQRWLNAKKNIKKTTTHSTGIMFSYRQDSSIATALKTWPFLDQGHLPLLCAFH